MSGLRFNLNVPEALVGDWRRWLAPGSLPRVGGLVEEAGFDAVSVTDHPYPPADWLANGGHHAMDPFVALSFLAAGSSGLRLLTNVLVLGYRHPAITANAIASLDALSGGRVIVGTAIGYLEPEFAAVGADFANRAGAFEEAVTAMKDAWSSADHVGDADGGAHVMLPPPVQRPHPPIWVGGNSAAARRRAVTLADGWMPFSQSKATAAVTGTPAVESVQDLAALVAKLEEASDAAGRTSPLEVCFGLPRRSVLHREEATDDEVDEQLGAYAEAGVTWLTVQSRAKTPDDLRRELDRWAPLVVRRHTSLRTV